MATPKKKHLIELMIEAGVEWLKGAKYAAQDKDTMHVRFYEKGKPFRSSNVNYWDSLGGSLIRSVKVKLPELCSNWHQTIVTREQYAKAIAVSGNGEQEQQTHSGEADVMPSESIESLLAEIKAKREEHTALVTKSEVLALEIASIEQQVNDKLKEYGFAMSQIDAQSGQVDVPWKIGDKCLVDDNQCTQSLIGKECVIVDIDSEDENLPYHVEFTNGNNYWVRNIRRP